LLIERGVAPESIRRGLACLCDLDASALGKEKLITDGERLFLLTADRERVLELLDRQSAFSLALGPLVDGLRVAACAADGDSKERGLAT
jgi:hypothetical protein